MPLSNHGEIPKPSLHSWTVKEHYAAHTGRWRNHKPSWWRWAQKEEKSSLSDDAAFCAASAEGYKNAPTPRSGSVVVGQCSCQHLQAHLIHHDTESCKYLLCIFLISSILNLKLSKFVKKILLHDKKILFQKASLVKWFKNFWPFSRN